jgi:hypothetical protein
MSCSRAKGLKMFAVAQSPIFTDKPKDTQIQTAVQFGQILQVHKNPELSNYYSIATHLLRSIFYVLCVIPSKPRFFFLILLLI